MKEDSMSKLSLSIVICFALSGIQSINAMQQAPKNNHDHRLLMVKRAISSRSLGMFFQHLEEADSVWLEKHGACVVQTIEQNKMELTGISQTASYHLLSELQREKMKPYDLMLNGLDIVKKESKERKMQMFFDSFIP